MLDYLWIALIGLAAALVAKLILPGQNGPPGLIGTMLIGLAGSFVGSFLGQFFGFYRPGELAGFLGSIVGAAAILLVWDLVFKKKARPPEP
jgi:uncharacterized membrane protein YeaQ/YmgE (transglycosylase-associated protein family)